ncbi:oligosaccharide flippase family protein [Tardiphaga sp.]|jgi:O-antigen/teichoic acid export membrane protein|uniref:oligosaccharide flippase family protein n=1 Tax=Tardiphaga sp. TaxID=1926292 RepID=UPI0037DA4E1A
MSVLFQSILITAATRILLVLTGLLSSVIVVRLLGAEGRGVFFYWTTLAGLAVQFGNFGLASSNTFYLARDRTLLGPLAANALLCSIFVGGISLLVLAITTPAHHTSTLTQSLLAGVASVLVVGSMYYMLGVNLLVAIKHYRDFNVFEIMNRSLALACIAGAAAYWRSAEAAFAGAAAASIIACAPLFLRLHSLSGGFARPDFALFRRGLNIAARAYITTLLGFIVLRFNAIYLQWTSGSATMGEWSIAAQILDTLGIIPTAVAIVLFPTILTSERPYEKMRKSLSRVALLMLGICAGAAVTGQPLISIVFGQTHEAAYEIMLYGLPSSFAVGLLVVISQFLASIGFPLALIAIWSAGLLVEIAVSLILVPKLDGVGAMIALSAAHTTIFLSALALAHRLRHVAINQKDSRGNQEHAI